MAVNIREPDLLFVFSRMEVLTGAEAEASAVDHVFEGLGLLLKSTVSALFQSQTKRTCTLMDASVNTITVLSVTISS